MISMQGFAMYLRLFTNGFRMMVCLFFTFHHTDTEGTVWEGLLQSLCGTGFEIAAVYPIHRRIGVRVKPS